MYNEKVNVMLSQQGFKTKPTGKELNTPFELRELTITQLAHAVEHGHTIANVFGEHSATTPQKSNFKYSQVVAIDIDGTSIDEDSLIYLLPSDITPNIYYQSYSSQTAKYNGEFAYHLLYCFSGQLNWFEYVYISNALNKQINKALQTTPDWHQGQPTQIVFGTNHETIIANTCLYDKTMLSGYTLDVAKQMVLDMHTQNGVLSKGFYQLPQTVLDAFGKKQAETTPTDKKATPKNKTLRFSDTLANPNNFVWFTSTEGATDWATVGDDVPAIEVSGGYYQIKPRRGRNGAIKKYQNGEGRRKKIYTYALIRKCIKPGIGFDELYYNAVMDLYNFMYNDPADQITQKDVERIIKNVLETETTEDVKSHFQTNKKTMVNPNYCKKYGVSKRTASNIGRKLITNAKILNWLDVSKSPMDNWRWAMENNIKVSKTKLYNLYKEYGIEYNKKAQKKNAPIIKTPIQLKNGFYTAKELKTILNAKATTLMGQYNMQPKVVRVKSRIVRGYIVELKTTTQNDNKIAV